MESVRGRDRSPPPPWNVDDVTRALSKGGGVLVNVQEWGCFYIFRRADDVTRTMSKGCVLVNVSPPPFQEILYPRLEPMNCAAPGPALALDATVTPRLHCTFVKWKCCIVRPKLRLFI